MIYLSTPIRMTKIRKDLTIPIVGGNVEELNSQTLLLGLLYHAHTLEKILSVF